MTGAPLPRLVQWLIGRGVPPDWRDSVEGDLIEERGRRLTAGRRGGVLWMIRDVALTGARLRVSGRAEGHSPGAVLTPPQTRLGGLVTDVTQAWRGLRTGRAQSAAAIVTLALGLGASATVFNLANWLLLRPLPGVADPSRLVTTWSVMGAGGHFVISVSDVASLQAGAQGLSGLAGHQNTPVHFAIEGGTARRLDAEVVTANYFDVLGRAIAIGRGFTTDEGVDRSLPPMAVISDRLWRRDLGGAADVVGRAVIVNRQSVRVVGVTVPGFHGTTLTTRSDLWMPIGQHRLIIPNYSDSVLTNRRSALFFDLIGRLAPGAMPATVAAEMEAVRTSLAAASPADTRLSKGKFVVTPLVEANNYGRKRLVDALTILMGLVGLVLLLTAANVGNLLMARAMARQGEIATRLALGASRARVARLLLIETLMLSLAAGALAIAGVWGAAAALDGTMVMQNLPPLDRAEIDWRVVGFALAAATTVAMGAGVFPVLAGGRVDLASAIRQSSRTYSTRRRVVRVLVAAQMAVSITLAIGAGLLVRSMLARLSIDAGFDASRVLSFAVEPQLQGYGERSRPVFGELLDRLRDVPGVRNAAVAWLRPTFQNVGSDINFRPEGAADGDKPMSSDTNSVSPDFFAAVGLPFVEGRTFTQAEFQNKSDGKTGSVIMTASLARRAFGPGSAVGRQITLAYPEGAVRTVVGVVRDTRQMHLLASDPDMLFSPFFEGSVGWASLVIGLASPDVDVVPGLRDAVRRVDPTLPIYDVFRADRAMRLQFADELLVTRLTVLFSGLALVVAAVGLYGVLARGVSERRREIGIRAALGASPRAVAAVVAREAMVMLAGGVAIGIGASFVLVRFLDTQLYGVTRIDPLSFIIAIAVVSVVTFVAMAPATRRAARLGTADVLR